MSQDTVGLDFIYWIDRAKPGGFVPWPARRAQAAIAAQAVERRIPHGRVTLWLWQAPNRVKVAFAMARLNGDAGERPVRVIHGPPPVDDGNKGQAVFEGEKA